MRAKDLILTILVAGASLAAAPRQEETVDQLIQRAETAPLAEQPALYIEVAQRQVQAADDLYAAGKVESARAAVDGVVTYSGKASDAATRSGKRIKHTEISLRKMAVRLRDIKRTLNFEDQAPVQSAADELEHLRTGLLSHMFGKEPK